MLFCLHVCGSMGLVQKQQESLPRETSSLLPCRESKRFKTKNFKFSIQLNTL